MSVEELSLDPYLIDSLINTGYEAYMSKINPIAASSCYPSYYYFAKEAYSSPSCYYVKTATEEQELNWCYGWNYYSTVISDVKLNAEKYWQPTIPYLENVEINGNKVSITWSDNKSDRSDIIGYKVFVGSMSREWEYANINATQGCYNYIVDRYKPIQYDKIGNLPCSDVYYIDTGVLEVEFELPAGIYYISIMPYDSHGDDAGREIYLMSNELRIQIL